jgi:hypothetical protein
MYLLSGIKCEAPHLSAVNHWSCPTLTTCFVSDWVFLQAFIHSLNDLNWLELPEHPKPSEFKGEISNSSV